MGQKTAVSRMVMARLTSTVDCKTIRSTNEDHRDTSGVQLTTLFTDILFQIPILRLMAQFQNYVPGFFGSKLSQYSPRTYHGIK